MAAECCSTGLLNVEENDDVNGSVQMLFLRYSFLTGIIASSCAAPSDAGFLADFRSVRNVWVTVIAAQQNGGD